MTTSDPYWRIKDLFAAALEKPFAERDAFLRDACADVPGLHDQIQALLEVHDRTSGMVMPSRDASHPASAYKMPSEHPGDMIGPYKLLQAIGEGGFGTVYMAEQEHPVRRRVALKIIKLGMDTRQVIARFEAERQALAMMDHAGIAKVFDAGATDTGRPYFVMELVKGEPITEYCDKNDLSVTQRLELFAQVCQAVQHAHNKGLIHRDIKPTNILVSTQDDRPNARVIDFGIAKATQARLTEKTLFTEFRQLIGTPEYMSPEQAAGDLDIDTRSDIYSLGVLLYELLTGTTPFDAQDLRSKAYDEIQRIIREVEPPKPSTRLSQNIETLAGVAAHRHTEPRKLSDSVRGELDWIVMKCLEKDRSRRYETALSVAMDVQRHLNDEPVEAGPPSARYRFRKFARRNRAALLMASVVVAALLAGTAVATWQAVVATRANQAALVAAASERKAKETAVARGAEMQAVLDFVLHKVFAAAAPKGKEGGLGREVTLRSAVEAALPFVESSFVSQPLIEARLRLILGRSFLYLGEANTALEQYKAARALYTRHRGPDDPDTLMSMNNMAVALGDLGRDAEALKLNEETLTLRRAKLGGDDPDTLQSMTNLANSYYALGRHAEALKLNEQTLAIERATLGNEHIETLTGMHNVANSYAAVGRHAEALTLREQTAALRKAKLGDDHPETLQSMTTLANSYYLAGRHAEALQLRERTLELQKASLGHDHPDTLRSMHNLATSYAALDRNADSLRLREEATALMKAKLGPDHPLTLLSMQNLAVGYSAVGRHADALTLREETLALVKTRLGPDHPAALASMGNLAASYADLGRDTEALKLNEETLALRKVKLGPDHPDTLGTMFGVAENLVKLDRGAEAVPIIDDCVRRAAGRVVHPRLISDMMDLRMRHYQKIRDAAGCLETAGNWEALNRTDAQSLYQSAYVRAVCAGVIEEGDKTPAGEAKAKEQANQAVQWLKQAVAAGYKDADHMKEDKNLDALRDREDFKKLLTEMKGSP